VIAFTASFNNLWPLNSFKMQVMTTRDEMFSIIYDICHVNGRGTYLVTLGLVCLLWQRQWLLGIEFPKYENLACKLAQFIYLIRRQHFGIERFKTIKEKEN
jgi:hypothetical protein